jgi:hypothetical protein
MAALVRLLMTTAAIAIGLTAPLLAAATPAFASGGGMWHSVEVELVALDVLHHDARLVIVIGRQ